MDQARRQVTEISNRIIGDLDNWRLFDAIAHLEDLIDRLLAEPGGYSVPLLSEPYGTLARIYWVLGDRKKAEEYVHKKLDIVDLYVPPGTKVSEH